MIAALAGASTASATFPGKNGPILDWNGLALSTVDPASGKREAITRVISSQADVTADGKTVFFAQQVPGTINASFYSMGIDGSNPQAIPGYGAILPNELGVTPAGDRIVFVGGVATGTNQGGLDGMNSIRADGTDVVHLQDNGRESPSFDISPDGKRIAYEVSQAYSYHGEILDFPDIWTMNINGTGRRPLVTGARFNDQLPSWSPDGKRIVFMRSAILENGPGPTDDDGYEQLVTVRVNSGRTEALTQRSRFQRLAPTYSPDGKLIAFTRRGSLFTMPARGGKARLLVRRPATEDVVAVAWAPR